jgi:HK97 family phage portal protein
MGILDRLRRDPSSESRSLPPPNNPPGVGLWDAASSSRTTPANVLSIADAFACVRALSDAAASLPLIAYRRRTAGARERLDGGELAALLTRPAPGSTQSALIGSIMAHLNLYGNAYIGKFRRAGSIVQLGLLHPDAIVPEVVAGEPRYSYSPGRGERQTLTSRDLIHVRGISTDGIAGLSPVRQARTILGLSSKLAGHADSFFSNDATPRGILKLQRFGDVDAQVESLRTAFEAQHAGLENAHRVAVVSGEVDFQALGMPLDDAQFLEQRKLSAVEVARIFRVPPWMIGADSGDSMTYANVEQQALAFVTYSLRPWLIAIEQAISADDDLAGGRTYVEFLLDGLLRADARTRSEVYTRALDPVTGWMNRDEVRRLENLEPEPDAPPRDGPALAAAMAAAMGSSSSSSNGGE